MDISLIFPNIIHVTHRSIRLYIVLGIVVLSVGEFKFLYELKIFSNLELLKMWCEHGAITTFPRRKIGYLKEGYEASLLVLDLNPLEKINRANEAIFLKVKQGVILGN